MYSESHIEGALFHDVFSADINKWLQSLDKSKIYLIYCNIGKRSGIALAKMEEMDFKNIYHMNQGLIQWKKLGYKTVSGSSEQNEFIPFDSDGITLSEHLIFNHFL
jgi:rhodanese-related sulfurtransferase